MKCFWCGDVRSGIEFVADGNELLLCSVCVLEALLTALKMSKYGAKALEPTEAMEKILA